MFKGKNDKIKATDGVATVGVKAAELGTVEGTQQRIQLKASMISYQKWKIIGN